MDRNVLEALGIPLDLSFEGGLSTDTQADVVKRIEEKTFFRLKEDMDVDAMISGVVSDASSTMDTLRNTLGKGMFGERFRFLERVCVIVCPERISVDEMSNHCVSIDEIMGEDIGKIFGRIMSLEGEARVRRQGGRWSFKSFTDIFKSKPEDDKSLADGLFLMQRYKEAYKVYSRYRGVDEFSQYCIEMSIYCLVLSKKPIPLNFINYLEMFEAESIRLVRMMSIIIGTENVAALYVLSLLDPRSLFKAFAQESLAQVLDSREYCRKKTELLFCSALRFYDAKHMSRSARCCENFLGLTDTILSGMDLSTLVRSGLVYCNKHIKRVLKSIKEETGTDSEDIEKEDEEVVIVKRELHGSICDFKGILNVVESVFLECKRVGLVSISNMESGAIRTYPTGQSIAFDGPGKFLMSHVTFNFRGIEKKMRVGIQLDVKEEASFMHLEVSDVCEVFCGELYSLYCKVIRSHGSGVKVYFDCREFITDKNSFSLEILFPSVGIYTRRVILETPGCIAYKDVKFVVVPSFSIDTFNYKHCLPLLFLRIESHGIECSRLRACSMLNDNFEVVGVKAVDPYFSYRDYAVEYFRKNIVGSSGSLSELPKATREDLLSSAETQKVLHAMYRSPPVSLDLLFGDLIPEIKNEIVLSGRGIYSVCVFLRGKKSLNELLNSKNESFSKIEASLPSSRSRAGLEDSAGSYNSSMKDFRGIPMKIEIEVSPKRICMFMLEETFGTLLFSRKKGDEAVPKSMNPFVYITYSSSILAYEPTIIYLCISNYCEHCTLDVRILSDTIAICSEDSTFSVEKLSFSLFEIRCMFKERKRYGSDDIKMSMKTGDEEIDYEWLVELPFVL
ncbi:hypothetical protein PFJ87_03g01450 [Encephalitozoon hellem]|uniref:Uncharacterized protein n=1 Tax=Encephalitozoon hellem TaxID=27973 RepID=A0ABY8CHC2_ENCHE|nr:hypothetical protein PFJ87_03g01450 [Encephalitozoon hellem]